MPRKQSVSIKLSEVQQQEVRKAVFTLERARIFKWYWKYMMNPDLDNSGPQAKLLKSMRVGIRQLDRELGTVLTWFENTFNLDQPKAGYKKKKR